MSSRISSPSIVNSVNGPMKIKGAEVPTPPNDNAIKVRKPYTISKQREKWSEEEHHKFLEALKLYGRAWRCIEEHIGTKTTIQIRSHAQKFFSKMERESAIGGCSINHGSSGDIEIPPPRPKRRSNHPYPRKEGNSHSTPYRLVEDTNSSPIEVLKEITGLTETKLRLFGKSFVIPENESEYSPKSEVSTGTEHISMEAGEISSTILQPISNTKSGVSDDETELVHQSVTSNLDCDEDGQTPNGASSASISMESQTPQQFPSQSCLPALNSMMPFPMYWPYNFGQYAMSKDGDGDGDGDGYDMNAFDHAATHAFIASAWSSMHNSLSGLNNNVNLLYSPTALMGSFRPQLSVTTCNLRKVMGNINDDVDNSKCSAQRNSENERCNAEDSSSDQCFDMASGTRNLSCSNEPSVTKRLKRSNVFDDGGRVSDENVCKSRSTLQSQVPPEVDNSIRVGIISNNEELRERDSHEFDNRPTLPFSLIFQGNRSENDRSAFTNMRTKAKAKPDGNQMNSRPIACSRYSGAGFVPYKRPPLAM